MLIPSPDDKIWHLYYEHYPGVSYGLSIADNLSGHWYQVSGYTFLATGIGTVCLTRFVTAVLLPFRRPSTTAWSDILELKPQRNSFRNKNFDTSACHSWQTSYCSIIYLTEISPNLYHPGSVSRSFSIASSIFLFLLRKSDWSRMPSNSSY